jgi:hypothetical protein
MRMNETEDPGDEIPAQPRAGKPKTRAPCTLKNKVEIPSPRTREVLPTPTYLDDVLPLTAVCEENQLIRYTDEHEEIVTAGGIRVVRRRKSFTLANEHPGRLLAVGVCVVAAILLALTLINFLGQ